MKKTLLTLCVALLACGIVHADLRGKKIYIDPGHGTYGSGDRLMNTIGIPASSVRDGYGFSESHTNLWKAEALQKKLLAAGAEVKMARTKNNVNPGLSERAEEAQTWGADYFISIHSNAASDGSTANYPLLLYKGKENGSYVNGDSKYRGQVMWPYLYEAFDGSAANKLEPNSHYSATSMNIRGDIDFMGGSSTTYINGVGYTGYYGVLRHGIPGFLSEGFFHTYQPARQRALNPDYCRQEGVRYYRGIAKYYGHADDTKGYIMGVVKDGQKTMTRSTTLSSTSWYYASGTHDQYRPINGAKVTLYNSSKQKVGEYTCDSYYNGVFVFNDLTPGTYYLDVRANGYANLTDAQRKVVVTANKTTYPIIKMSAGTYDENNEFSTVETITFAPMWTKTASDLGMGTSNQNRSMFHYDGNLYIADNGGAFHIINATNGTKVATKDYSGVLAFPRHNIRITEDGQMLVGNSNIDNGKLHLYTSDVTNGGATLVDSTAVALGGRADFFHTYGTWNESGYLLTVVKDQSKVVKVPFAAGKLGTPVAISNSAVSGGNADKAYPIDETSFYLSRNGKIPTRNSLTDGAVLEEFGDEAPVAANASGLAVFTIHKHTYMVTPATRNGDFDIFDITDGISKATKVIASTSTTAFSAATNGSLTVDFCTRVVGNDVFIYVLVPSNGVAAYKFTYTPPKGEEENPNNPEQPTPDATYGDVKFYLQGGTLEVPADNETLWAQIAEAYVPYYGTRSPQDISACATFLNGKAKLVLTDAKSPLLWLGNYILSIVPDLASKDDGHEWARTLDGFLNCKADGVHWAQLGDWTEAGKPVAWQPFYTFMHQPTKENHTFLGWYDNAKADGAAFTALPASGDVYACWKSNISTDMATVENALDSRILPTMDGVAMCFAGTQDIAIYHMNGVLIHNTWAMDYYTYSLPQGMYIIRIGDAIHKFVR